MAMVLKDSNGRSAAAKSLDGHVDKNKALVVGSPSREVENSEPARASQDVPGPDAGTGGSMHRAITSKLSKAEVQDIFKNCIKLAAESKINAKNSFSLHLIDHMDDLVKGDAEEGKTNFQQASCTLDAGVQIYSYRVDAVHTDAFKTLQGLHRTAIREEDGAAPAGGDEDEDGCEVEGAAGRRKQRKQTSPESTLESFEALNMKKLDLGFAVDPLFHRTSAQFDAGGAHGLLLHNLGVLRGCEIVFDSRDKPEEILKAQAPCQDVQIDTRGLPDVLSRPPLGGVVMSPAVEELRKRLSQGSGALPSSHSLPSPAEIMAAALSASCGSRRMPPPAPEAPDPGPPEEHGEDSWEPESAFFTADEGGADEVGAESSVYYGMSEEIGGGEVSMGGAAGPSASLGYEAGLSAASGGQGEGEVGAADEDGGIGPLQRLLEAGLGHGQLSGTSWAGSSHWRYRATGSGPKTASAGAGGSPQSSSLSGAARGRRSKGKAVLDFLNLPPIPDDAFKLAEKPATLCLAASTLGTKAPTLLPEDHKYQLQDLAKLFLRPRSLWTRQHTAAATCNACPEMEDGVFEDGGGYDGDTGFEGDNEAAFDTFQEAVEAWGATASDGMQLAEAPRKVAKVQIGYSRAAKQVDVRALKELLWDQLEDLSGEAAEEPDGEGSSGRLVSFDEVLRAVPEGSAAGELEDLSVHLCFICALHLANEHGLAITSGEGLDTVSISLPRSVS